MRFFLESRVFRGKSHKFLGGSFIFFFLGEGEAHWFLGQVSISFGVRFFWQVGFWEGRSRLSFFGSKEQP